MTDAVTQSFRSDDAELRRMSEWFRDFARRTTFPLERALDFELCLNELMANAIQHGSAGPDHEIRITLQDDAGSLRATLEDDGRPFDPLTLARRPGGETLESIRPGGWGIPIVRALADELRYERRDGRNVVAIGMGPDSPASSR